MEERWASFHEAVYKRSRQGLIKTWWISDHGRVKITNNINERVEWPKLSATGGHEGNRYLAISINNAVEKYVHRLVARFFVANPWDTEQVNHLDGVKANNHYQNLEWATLLENVRHYWEMGADPNRVIISNNIIDTAAQNNHRFNKWLACWQLKQEGLKTREIAEQLNLPIGSVGCILWKIKHGEGATGSRIHNMYVN